MTNKLNLVKKSQKHTKKETKPKLTDTSPPVRTAHMNVHITEYKILHRIVPIIFPLILKTIP